MHHDVTVDGDKKFDSIHSNMNIESELPEDFDELDKEQKIEKLEQLKSRLDADSESGALKRRIIEEMIRKYS